MHQHYDKTLLRRYLRQQRQQIKPELRKETTSQINRLLYPLIRRGKRIAAYWAIGSELSLWSFIATAQHRGAEVYLPCIAPKQRQLWFTRCPHLPRQPATARYLILHGLKRRRKTIPQFGGPRLRARSLNTVIVPLLGIDQQGNRLGQGGGYYDATLAALPPWHLRLTGVGFKCQLIDKIESEKHDIRIPFFICEQGIRNF